jgi:hypothetical protein
MLEWPAYSCLRSLNLRQAATDVYAQTAVLARSTFAPICCIGPEETAPPITTACSFSSTTDCAAAFSAKGEEYDKTNLERLNIAPSLLSVHFPATLPSTLIEIQEFTTKFTYVIGANQQRHRRGNRARLSSGDDGSTPWGTQAYSAKLRAFAYVKQRARLRQSSPLRILIADDHEFVRKGVCAILTSHFNPEICPHGVR